MTSLRRECTGRYEHHGAASPQTNQSSLSPVQLVTGQQMNAEMQNETSMETQGVRPEQEQPSSAGSRRRSARLVVFAAALVLVLASLAYGATTRGSGQLQSGPAPDFTLGLFDGGEISLSDLRGQIVVLNFWASWCTPCKEEAPMLESVWQRYAGQGVAVIGVDYKDTEPAARAFLDQFGITYPNGPDTRSRIAGAYGVQGVPETFVITQQGEIAKVFVGSPTEAQLTAVLEDLLARAEE